MSRALLEQAGYNPDESYELTPEDVCGAALLDVIKIRGAFPLTASEALSVIDIANGELVKAGLQPTIDQEIYGHVAGVIEATGIHA